MKASNILLVFVILGAAGAGFYFWDKTKPKKQDTKPKSEWDFNLDNGQITVDGKPYPNLAFMHIMR